MFFLFLIQVLLMAAAYQLGHVHGKRDAGNAIILFDELTDTKATFTMYGKYYEMSKDEFKAHMLKAMESPYE